jgi:hypothetical protein
MNLGAEPRKVVLLAILGAIALYFVYSNLFSSDDGGRPAAVSPRPASETTPPLFPDGARPEASVRRMPGRATQEYRPTMKRRPEDRIDPTKVDPTLRLDLLAKLASVQMEGGERSLFDFADPPAPKQVASAKPEEKIIPKPLGPEPPPKKVEPAKPAPPPVPLKFYGFVNPTRNPQKRAFFLDGDEIIVAGEGEVIRRRYRVIRIGVNSAVVEDVEHKHEETLPLVQEQS